MQVRPRRSPKDKEVNLEDPADDNMDRRKTSKADSAMQYQGVLIACMCFIFFMSALFKDRICVSLVEVNATHIGGHAIGSASDMAASMGSVFVGDKITKRQLDATVTTVMVTGAGGYIGSHMVLALLDAGSYTVVGVDDMTRGSWETLIRLQELAKDETKFVFVKSKLTSASLAELLIEHKVDLVVHMAGCAFSAAGEALQKPQVYIEGIAGSTTALLSAMESAKVTKLLHASSAEVYGSPAIAAMKESMPALPSTTIGKANLQAEEAIMAFQQAQKAQGHTFSAAVLRHFTVIGADSQGRMGLHLYTEDQLAFPSLIDEAFDVALGSKEVVTQLLTNLATDDGSKEQDYIHVTDVASAYLVASKALVGSEPMVYNLGTGLLVSGKTLLAEVKMVAGKPVPATPKKDTTAGPVRLNADMTRIKAELGWEPAVKTISPMVQTAWEWKSTKYGPTSAPIDPLMYNGPAFTPETDDMPPLKNNPKIVIIGAGPCGICAAYRLHELGYTNWEILEAKKRAGGLATSIMDSKGFTWDIGVHVLFSHFEFFDALLDQYMPPKQWMYHQRWSPAWMRDRWVGYPIQSNVWRLPKKEVTGIIEDLATMSTKEKETKPRNFLAWLEAGFGKALTKSFMAPYNFKVWAHPPKELNSIWVGERVATVKFEDILGNVIDRKDAPAWGPNSQFRYPMNGTGQIWETVFDTLPPENKKTGARVKTINTAADKKKVVLDDGTEVKYDALLSTLPINDVLRNLPDHPELAKYAEGEGKFKHQTVNLVGVGIWGQPPDKLSGVHWIYYPEEEFLFYRVTVLSNFSPNVVPKPTLQWSLLAEVSESKYRHPPKDVEELKRKVIEGYKRSGLLTDEDKIESVWSTRLEYGYPVPYVERNMHVHQADHALRQLHIWSRGRFGNWKYEVANQDHSCMLGVDAVDNMLFGGSEEGREATFNTPNKVNMKYRKYDWTPDPAKEMARAAKAGVQKHHTFGKPVVKLTPRIQWDLVTFHCKEDDHWVDQVPRVMPTWTKWLVNMYETCGLGDIKRNAKEMLREAVNHHDRIPFHDHPQSVAAFPHHVIQHYKKLPHMLIFVLGPTMPKSSKFFHNGEVAKVYDAGEKFAMWGDQRVEEQSVSAKLKELCEAVGVQPPPSVVSMTNPTVMVARERILAVPLDKWKALLNKIDKDAAAAEVLHLLWPTLLGSPTPGASVLQKH